MSLLLKYNFINIGTKIIQEDAYQIYKFEKSDWVFVFDGHGAIKQEDSLPHIIIKYQILKKKIIEYFIEKNIKINSNSLRTFFQLFDIELSLNNKIMRNTGFCLCGIILDKETDKIYILNTGDTKVSLFYNKEKVFETPEHNLKNKSEVERIIKKNKEKYIKNNRYKTLSTTRIFGDFDCKEASNDPLIAIPEIFVFNNNKPFLFLLYTDGLLLNYKEKEIINNKYNLDTLDNYFNNINNKNKNKYKIVDNICCILVLNELSKKKLYINPSKLNNIFRETINVCIENCAII